MSYKCHATQHSDLMICKTCNLRWDTNDSEPPVCKMGWQTEYEVANEDILSPPAFADGAKDGNPKDAIGITKWGVLSTVPSGPLFELGLAMAEGARKYGRHNYRIAGVRASVYYDAAMRHLISWWEGEDIDPDSGLSHLTKAMACMIILRDADINGKLVDDRPPETVNWGDFRDAMQRHMDDLRVRLPDAMPPHTKGD